MKQRKTNTSHYLSKSFKEGGTLQAVGAYIIVVVPLAIIDLCNLA